MARAARFAPAIAVAALLVALVASGCDEEKQRASEVAALRSESPGTAECAACSMVVREQPAPRGQVVHRDGTRRFVCSLADLAHYLDAPSKHGEARAIFVEVLDPSADPRRVSAAARPWVRAGQAHFVVGVKRPRVMGKPALAYRTRAEAERIASAHGRRVVDFAALRRALTSARR